MRLSVEVLDALLQDGRAVVAPSVEEQAAITHLEAEGFIRQTREPVFRCFDPADDACADHPTRACLAWVPARLDEDRVFCPACGVDHEDRSPSTSRLHLDVDARRVVGASMVLLFTGSALYHGLTNTRLKHIFWVVDHAFIYLLIAGTYTPFTLVTIRGGWGWSIFGVAWGLAIIGIVFKLVAIGKYPKVSIALYLIMGWIIVIALYPLIMAMSWTGLALLGLGGLLYTVGTIFYAWYSLRFGHVVWHLFVLGGAAAHFFAVLYDVIPLEG